MDSIDDAVARPGAAAVAAPAVLELVAAEDLSGVGSDGGEALAMRGGTV
ncbi:hypothetical protein OG196_24370 [Kitasatospora purpeofusca]|nr:hypothetical protein OG196_24370 [Kitasatospora purpeofusca]